MIRQRGTTFQVRVYAGADPATGKPRHLYGTAPNKRTARKLEGDLERQAQNFTPSLATMTDVYRRWLTVARLAPSTLHTTEKRWDRHIGPAIGDFPLPGVSTALLDGLYAKWEGEGLAPATVVRMHGVIRAALEQAVTWEWIDRNPASRCRLPEVPAPVPVAPPVEDVRRIVVAADPDLRTCLRLLAVTGMRRGEVCALRRTDLDLERASVLKARAISHGVEQGTKTGARYQLALDKLTVAYLGIHLAVMDERAREFGTGCAPDAFVFSHELDCSRPWRPDGLTQRFARLRDSLGLSVRLKDLRSWMVTTLFLDGGDPRSVAGRAGHSRATTTLNHYAAWVPAADRALANAVGGLLDGNDPDHDT